MLVDDAVRSPPPPLPVRTRGAKHIWKPRQCVAGGGTAGLQGQGFHHTSCMAPRKSWPATRPVAHPGCSVSGVKNNETRQAHSSPTIRAPFGPENKRIARSTQHTDTVLIPPQYCSVWLSI